VSERTEDHAAREDYERLAGKFEEERKRCPTVKAILALVRYGNASVEDALVQGLKLILVQRDAYFEALVAAAARAPFAPVIPVPPPVALPLPPSCSCGLDGNPANCSLHGPF